MPEYDVLSLVVAATWLCLCQPVTQNGIFKQIFLSKDVLSQMFSAGNLSFAPGLLDAMQALTPPSISFFENLPWPNDGKV